MSTRGEHLMRGGLLFVNGSGLLGRLFARSFAFVLDQIEDRLEVGGIELTLPDGSRRRIGFKADGPVAVVRLNGWYALVRLVTSGSIGWYRAGPKASGPRRTRCRCLRCSRPMRATLVTPGARKVPARLLNLLKHQRRDNDVWKARKNVAAHYDLGNDFYAAWLDQTMTYSAARFASPSESLEQAQLRKVHMLLDRLDLKPGDQLLEIGCGWGNAGD